MGRVIHHNQSELTECKQVWLNVIQVSVIYYIKRTKTKTYDHLNRIKIVKNPIVFHNKHTQQTRNRG